MSSCWLGSVDVLLPAALLASCFAGSPDSPDNEQPLTAQAHIRRWTMHDSITGQLIASGCKTPLRIEAEIGRQLTVTKTTHYPQVDGLAPDAPVSCPGSMDAFWCSDHPSIEDIPLCVIDDPACWTPMENGPVVILEQELLTPLRECPAQPRPGGTIGRGLKTKLEVVGTGMMELIPSGACNVETDVLLTILPPG